MISSDAVDSAMGRSCGRGGGSTGHGRPATVRGPASRDIRHWFSTRWYNDGASGPAAPCPPDQAVGRGEHRAREGTDPVRTCGAASVRCKGDRHADRVASWPQPARPGAVRAAPASPRRGRTPTGVIVDVAPFGRAPRLGRGRDPGIARWWRRSPPAPAATSAGAGPCPAASRSPPPSSTGPTPGARPTAVARFSDHFRLSNSADGPGRAAASSSSASCSTGTMRILASDWQSGASVAVTAYRDGSSSRRHAHVLPRRQHAHPLRAQRRRRVLSREQHVRQPRRQHEGLRHARPRPSTATTRCG